MDLVPLAKILFPTAEERPRTTTFFYFLPRKRQRRREDGLFGGNILTLLVREYFSSQLGATKSFHKDRVCVGVQRKERVCAPGTAGGGRIGQIHTIATPRWITCAINFTECKSTVTIFINFITNFVWHEGGFNISPQLSRKENGNVHHKHLKITF